MPAPVAMGGTGPSGGYRAQALLKARPNLRVGLIDRLPVPQDRRLPANFPDAGHSGGIWCDRTRSAADTDFTGIQIHGRLWLRGAQVQGARLNADRFPLSHGYAYT